ncbi:NUDIX domain-containing protein [Streptomyces sp. NPDC052236]|uniref:NUDIX domain-containing protein n=1 Tax=Streptomyces sp. NPDC052236 TaxID=3365686 RepID=UPI0037D1DEFB
MDGAWEDVVDALVREAQEETGVVIDRADVRAAVTVHHRGPGGNARVGIFFEVHRWAGDPQVMEPEVCDAMKWVPLDNLPAPMVAYCRAGLDAYQAGGRLAVRFQQPSDPIAHDPAADRLQLIPGVSTSTAPGQPALPVVEFAERAVGRITRWDDTSWPGERSRVWRVTGAIGGTWFVKTHQNDRFHDREVRAYRTWVPQLEPAAPRLVAADHALRAMVVTAVQGQPLHGAVHPADQERRIFHRIGSLARRIHRSAPPRPAPAGSTPAVKKAERHLRSARPHLMPGDVDLVRALVRRGEKLPPLEWVETHGDFQLLH